MSLSLFLLPVFPHSYPSLPLWYHHVLSKLCIFFILSPLLYVFDYLFSALRQFCSSAPTCLPVCLAFCPPPSGFNYFLHYFYLLHTAQGVGLSQLFGGSVLSVYLYVSQLFIFDPALVPQFS